MRSSLLRRWLTGGRHVVGFVQQSCKKTTKNPTQREKYLYPRFPRGWSRDECRIGHALLLALLYILLWQLLFRSWQWFSISLFCIYGSYESTTRCVAIAGKIPALLNEMHFSVRQITLPCRIFHASRKWFHPFVLHVRTNNLLNGPLTLGNDFFYSYASYRESIDSRVAGPFKLDSFLPPNSFTWDTFCRPPIETWHLPWLFRRSSFV